MTTQSLPRDGARSLRLITHDGDEPLDRWTVVPEDLDDDQRFTAWISADPSTIVDLDDHR